MSDRMNRRLSWAESIGLQMHLFMCGACKNVLKQLKGLRQLFRAYRFFIEGNKSSSSSLSLSAKNKLRQILSNQ